MVCGPLHHNGGVMLVGVMLVLSAVNEVTSPHSRLTMLLIVPSVFIRTPSMQENRKISQKHMCNIAYIYNTSLCCL